MTTIRSIQKKMSTLKKELDTLNGELVLRLPTQLFYCEHCHRQTQLKNISLVQEMYYTSATGCTGGDYWSPSQYLVVCPKCTHRTRAYSTKFDAEKQKLFEFVESNRTYFKEFLTWYPQKNYIRGEVFDLEAIRKEYNRKHRR